MAFQFKAITSFLLMNIVLAMSSHALAKPTKKKLVGLEEMKHPEWFFGRGGTVNIPGVGGVTVPGYGSSIPHLPRGFRLPSYPGYTGNGGYSGTRYGSSPHRYAPRTSYRGYRSSSSSPHPLYNYGSSTHRVPGRGHRRSRASPYHRYSRNGGHSGIRYGSPTRHVHRAGNRSQRYSPDPLYTGSTSYGSSGHHAHRNRRRGYRSSHRPRYTGNGRFSGPRYIPGGDDTFVPNPGYEVPIPNAP